MAISLLNEREYRITDKVTVFIPTLGEYRDKTKRSDYEILMNLFLLTPSNYMLELSEAGRDFTKISEYDFFIENFFVMFLLPQIQKKEINVNSKLLFKDLDFKTLLPQEQENGRTVLVNADGDIVIDEYVYIQIGLLFCEILNIKKYRKKPANKIARDYFLELEREHRNNAKRINQKAKNNFDEMIIAMVCNPNFPYDFETINSLTIYDFYCCVQQIMKWVNYENLMRGIYSGFGAVDPKKVKKSEFNWLSFRT